MMTKIHSLTVLKSLSLFALSSNMVQAVETTDSSSSISLWPFILFAIILIAFRKKIMGEATPNPEDHGAEHHEVTEQKPQKSVEQDPPIPSPVEESLSPAEPEAKAGNINLKDDSGQCQASTTKGTRCKRTTTLEEASITIDGTTYDLTVCKQHNNDAMKPFADLIK